MKWFGSFGASKNSNNNSNTKSIHEQPDSHAYSNSHSILHEQSPAHTLYGEKQPLPHQNQSGQDGELYDSVDAASGVRNAGVHNSMFVENCTVDQCFQVVSDVERYPEFLPVYKQVLVLEKFPVRQSHGSQHQQNSIPHNAHHLSQPQQLPQTSAPSMDQVWIAQYTISTFFKTFTYKLRLDYHLEPNRYAKITWNQVEGPFEINNGAWELFAREKGTEAHYSFNVGFTLYVPSMVKNWVLNSVMKDSMEAIKHRIQAVSSVTKNSVGDDHRSSQP